MRSVKATGVSYIIHVTKCERCENCMEEKNEIVFIKQVKKNDEPKFKTSFEL